MKNLLFTFQGRSCGVQAGGDFKGPMRQVKAVELRSEPAHWTVAGQKESSKPKCAHTWLHSLYWKCWKICLASPHTQVREPGQNGFNFQPWSASSWSKPEANGESTGIRFSHGHHQTNQPECSGEEEVVPWYRPAANIHSAGLGISSASDPGKPEPSGISGGSRLLGIPHWILHLGMSPDMSGDHRTFLVSVFWARSICTTWYLPQKWRSQHSWWFLSPLHPPGRSWHQCWVWLRYSCQP